MFLRRCPMEGKSRGILYTVGEARIFASSEYQKGRLDVYPYELFGFLCGEVERLERRDENLRESCDIRGKALGRAEKYAEQLRSALEYEKKAFRRYKRDDELTSEDLNQQIAALEVELEVYHRLQKGCPICLEDGPVSERAMLDKNGVLCSVSGEPGRWGHGYDDYHWYCDDAGAMARNDALEAQLDELRSEVVYWRGSCGSCGEKMTGEWMDGSELTCPECGVEVEATAMEDGAWTFLPLYENEDDEEKGSHDG